MMGACGVGKKSAFPFARHDRFWPQGQSRRGEAAAPYHPDGGTWPSEWAASVSTPSTDTT
jgi:hypothetical protein